MPEAGHAAGHRAESRAAARAREVSAVAPDRAALFQWPVRVYHEDTDADGVVYYANYLKFIERARTEWLRSHGFDLTELEARHGIVFAVRAVAIDYLRPGRLSDALLVTLRLIGSGRTYLELAQQVLRAGTLLADARIHVVCLRAKAFKPTRIPPVVIERLASDNTERKS